MIREVIKEVAATRRNGGAWFGHLFRTTMLTLIFAGWCFKKRYENSALTTIFLKPFAHWPRAPEYDERSRLSRCLLGSQRSR